MRKLARLLLAACGGSQAPGSPSDSCAAPLAAQGGTPADDEALALIPARTVACPWPEQIIEGRSPGSGRAGWTRWGSRSGDRAWPQAEPTSRVRLRPRRTAPASTTWASDAAGNILVTGSTPTAVAPAFTDQAESDAFVSSRCFFAFGRLARGV